MNRETTDDVDDPLFASHRKFRTLEQQLYGHVLAAIDFARLSTYEQLAYTLMRKHDVGDDLALDLSMQLVQRALERVATDTARYFDSGPPPGITHAEPPSHTMTTARSVVRKPSLPPKAIGATPTTNTSTRSPARSATGSPKNGASITPTS